LVAQGSPLPPAGKAPVEIYLTASDKHSSSVSLDQSEVIVTLDKQTAQVISARPAKQDKLLFAVLIDMSTSNRMRSEFIKGTADALFQGLSTEENQGYIVLFDVSANHSNRPLRPSEVHEVLKASKFGGGTALFDAVFSTCKSILSKSRNPENSRRVIILLSDGDDNQSSTRAQEAIKSAEKEGISIFAIATSKGFYSGSRGFDVLKEFTDGTGGRLIANYTLEDGVKAMLAAIDSQWKLSIIPPPPSDRDLHSFQVKSSQKNVQIVAPEKIFLP